MRKALLSAILWTCAVVAVVVVAEDVERLVREDVERLVREAMRGKRDR